MRMFPNCFRFVRLINIYLFAVSIRPESVRHYYRPPYTLFAPYPVCFFVYIMLTFIMILKFLSFSVMGILYFSTEHFW